MTCPDSKTLSPEHWAHFIALLSMDMTAPAWPQLGLKFTRPMNQAVQEIRVMIQSLRDAYRRTPDPVPDIRDWLFTHNALNWPESDLEMLCKFGLRFTPDHADAPQLSAWQIVLASFPEGFSETLAACPDKAIIEGMTDRLFGTMDPVTVPTKLSDWDLQLCARHEWNPESDAGFPPIDTLEIVQSLYRARDALIYAAQALPQLAQDALWAEARAKVEAYGIWMPEPLDPLWLRVSHAPI